MEFLRFGSSIPGSYWGCCACDIIQNFNVDPDEKANIQLVSGDGGGPLMKGKELAFVGLTYREIFQTRLRIGTFSMRDMPNHAFFAILTQTQCDSDTGKKWLAILKEAGFEFLRAQDNSVYTGENLETKHAPHPNYVFALFRNIGKSAIEDPNKPPAGWDDLPEPKSQEELWKEGKTVILTEKEVVADGQEPVLAGKRSPWMPQTRETRQAVDEHLAKGGAVRVEGYGGRVALLAIKKDDKNNNNNKAVSADPVVPV